MEKPSFEEKTRFRGLDLAIQTEQLWVLKAYFRITIFRVVVDSVVINW